MGGVDIFPVQGAMNGGCTITQGDAIGLGYVGLSVRNGAMKNVCGKVKCRNIHPRKKQHKDTKTQRINPCALRAFVSSCFNPKKSLRNTFVGASRRVSADVCCFAPAFRGTKASLSDYDFFGNGFP
jgi:hypothetical protein